MESLNFHNINLEKANAILRYKKRQRVAMLFRFIEFCIFFIVISRFSAQLPLNFKLSMDYFKGLGATLISPRFVFILGNAIVIILFLNSGHSFTKDDSTSNIKFDLYDEYKQIYSMKKEDYCEQIKKQENQVEKGIHRSHSDNSLCSSHVEKKPRKQMIRSATVGCLKDMNTNSVKPTRKTMTTNSYHKDGMSNDEFRKTIEAFIARQQRLLREEELSNVFST